MLAPHFFFTPATSFLCLANTILINASVQYKSESRPIMADDNDEGGFLCMDLGSDVESGAEAEVKVPRDYQSKIDYEKQKAEWKPIVEKGEVSLTVYF